MLIDLLAGFARTLGPPSAAAVQAAATAVPPAQDAVGKPAEAEAVDHMPAPTPEG
jgi:hypothetical protein